jgi:hypothetical protein
LWVCLTDHCPTCQRPRDRGRTRVIARRCYRRTASTSTIDAGVWARRQPPLFAPAIKAPDGRSFLPFCVTFPHHQRKPPPASRRVEPPFVDSSRIAHLCDLALPLPQVLSSVSSSFALPDASGACRPPTAGESYSLRL